MMAAFRREHELHRRRFGRNLGLGLVLAAFVAVVFGLTIAKVGQHPPHLDDFAPAPGASTGTGQ